MATPTSEADRLWSHLPLRRPQPYWRRAQWRLPRIAQWGATPQRPDPQPPLCAPATPLSPPARLWHDADRRATALFHLAGLVQRWPEGFTLAHLCTLCGRTRTMPASAPVRLPSEREGHLGLPQRPRRGAPAYQASEPAPVPDLGQARPTALASSGWPVASRPPAGQCAAPRPSPSRKSAPSKTSPPTAPTTAIRSLRGASSSASSPALGPVTLPAPESSRASSAPTRRTPAGSRATPSARRPPPVPVPACPCPCSPRLCRCARDRVGLPGRGAHHAGQADGPCPADQPPADPLAPPGAGPVRPQRGCSDQPQH